MDDIDLIREFGSEFPGPDAGETARVRARLTTAVNAAPARSATDPEERLVADARGRRATGAARRAPRRKAVRRRRLVLVACAAAAVAAAALIVPGLFTRTPLGGVQNAAAAALNKVADVAAGQVVTAPPTAGQFMYTKSQDVWESTMADVGVKGSVASQPGASPTPMTSDDTINVLMPVTREIWIALDGRGRLLETDGTPRFVTPHDKAVWQAAGKPDLGGGKTSDESFGKGGLSYTDLSKLPTDADALRKLIVERKVEGGPAGDAETFTIIGDLLRETYAPPALRAALYRIAATLPGVELLGTVRDHAGRSGTAVAYSSHGDRNELIFDPTTSALLGEESMVVDPARARIDVPAGTVMGWSVYLASGVVDTTSQRAS